MSNNQHIFLSYRSLEVEFALKLAADLKNAGINIWVDRLDGIRSGDDWRLEIQHALSQDTCAGMISIISPDYLSSKYCRDEIGRADRLNIPIFPLTLRPVPDDEWPLEIERIQFIDFNKWRDPNTYQTQLSSLISILSQQFPAQKGAIPDVEVRYLNNLVAQLEAWQGVLEYVGLSGQLNIQEELAFRPDPRLRKWEAGLALLLQDQVSSVKSDSFEKTPIKDIRAVVDDYPRFALIGAPGAGKTTTLRYLATEAARERIQNPLKPLPLFFRLPDWGEESSLEEFIRTQWNHSKLPFETDPIELLLAGEAFLFLDGLNEMGADGSEKAQLLRTWLAKSPHEIRKTDTEPIPPFVVVTCRDRDYSGPLDLGLPKLLVDEMSDQQIQIFVNNYLGNEAGLLLKHIYPDNSQKDPHHDLAHLARNPYMLTALIIIFQNTTGGELPANNGLLFRGLVRTLWEREKQKQTTGWVPHKQLETELSRLAFTMIDSNRAIDVSSTYASLYIQSEDLIHAALSANLLLSRGATLSFSHQLIQEYFAALGLQKVGLQHIQLEIETLRARQVRPILENLATKLNPHQIRFSTKWDQVVIALCGIINDPEPLIAEVATFNPLLALDCIMSGIEIDLNKITPSVIAALFNPDANVRWGAINCLAELNVVFHQRSRFLQQFVEALGDPDSDIQAVAIETLEQIGQLAVPSLLQGLSSHNVYERANSAIVLGHFNDPNMIPILVTKYLDEDATVRRCVIEALGTMGGQDVTNTLLDALDDSDAVVQIKAARALGRNPYTAPYLLSMMQKSDGGSKQKSAKILEQITDTFPAFEKLPFLKDRYPYYHELSDFLKQLERSQEILINALKSTNLDIQISIALTLGHIGAVKAVPELINLLGNPHWPVHFAAYKALVSMRKRKGVQSFKGLKSKDIRRREHAIKEIKRKYGTIGLLHALNHDGESYWDISYELIKSPSKDDLIIIDALDTNILRAKGMLAYVIGKRGNSAYAPHLVPLLVEKRPFVRGQAVEALGNLKYAPATAEIKKLLFDKAKIYSNSNEKVCDAAATALGKIDTPEAIEAVNRWNENNKQPQYPLRTD